MRVLQVCHKIPWPLHDGGAVSLYNSARGLLSQNQAVKVLALATSKEPVDLETIPADFRKAVRFESCHVDTRIKPFQALLNLFSGQSYFVERFFSGEFNSTLIHILEQEEFDVVQLEHSYLGLYLPAIRKHAKARVVLRPQNVEHQVWERFLEKEPNPLKKRYLRIAASRLRKFEIHLANAVDGIIAISPGDAEIFHHYAPATPQATVPIGFDFSVFSSYDTEKQYEIFPLFYHLGSMDWMPNIQGLKWFSEEVIPFIRKEYPEFVLRIAGKKMGEWFYRHQGGSLAVDGAVEDAFRYQEDKAVMIVPLLSGGGLRVKIIEAMALGKTIITTTIGAEGIPYTDGENILIADTKEEFSRQIIKCRDSNALCRTIGKNAHRLAMENYDFKTTGRKMVEFYEKLL